MLPVPLCNIGNNLTLAQKAAVIEMEVQLAWVIGGEELIFRSLLDKFFLLAIIGQWFEAQAAWNQLDRMGRAWSRAAYRPGLAEYRYARFRFQQGKLQEEQLAEAEKMLELGKGRSSIRNCRSFRGEWHLERHEWSLAAASLHEAVAMARSVGKTDASSETQLALARFHLNQLPNPHEEADRLADYGSTDDLAELYLALGDPDRAKHHALAAYKRHWADGEPYVHRYYLNKSRALLEKLNVPIPNLPPYDPATRQPFHWEPAACRHRQTPRSKKTKTNPKPARNPPMPNSGSFLAETQSELYSDSSKLSRKRQLTKPSVCAFSLVSPPERQGKKPKMRAAMNLLIDI